MLYAEIFLYAIGAAVLIAFLFQNIILSIAIFMLVAAVFTLTLRPWEVTLERVITFVDREVDALEYSSGLLLLPQAQLSGLAQLQQQRVAGQLEEQIKTVQPETNLLRVAIISGSLILLGFLLYQFGVTDQFKSSQPSVEQEEIIVFKPADSTAAKIPQPKLVSQKVTITYPAYTGIAAFTTNKMDIEAVEGSRITWQIRFDAEVDSAQMESMGTRYPMELNEKAYSRTSVLNNSGFYNFRFKDTAGGSYVSDLYSIEVTKDRDPVIEVPDLKQFNSFNFDEDKNISFHSIITDDFGIADAYIIATVSKGTGESVKFREEKLDFESGVQRGSKKLELSKGINLDNMKMEPGDELYFYIEARDLKEPQANVARSETYFAVIKDTLDYGEGVEGTMGVDLMPAYFRSQRQLIIDTEELISQRNKVPKDVFNTTSNNLGFDQKALRIKYGEFMGDESEGSMDVSDREMPGADEDEKGEEQDPLAEFTHDHDGDNEHNLVVQDDHDHEEEEEGSEAKDPLAEFLHDHGDPESSTLFTDNLKSKLRQALSIMWDAELHLRLYEPEKSLPYQYQALALIQEIKNSARIYVHRIGYDPAPIKEEVRLTGNIDEVFNVQKTEDLEEESKYAFMRRSVLRLEELISGESKITAEDRKIFEQAGNELAEQAIEEPGKHLSTLQQIKWVSEERQPERETLIEVQKGLLKALPKPDASPGKGENYTGEINKLFLKELELND